MNLHAVVRNAITGINPDETLTLYQALSQTEVDGWATAQYMPAVTVQGQVQSMPRALTQADALNTDTEEWRIYLYAESAYPPNTLDRYTGRTGDMIRRDDGRWYLVTGVNDDFNRVGWVCVTATLQTEGVDDALIVSEDSDDDDS